MEIFSRNTTPLIDMVASIQRSLLWRASSLKQVRVENNTFQMVGQQITYPGEEADLLPEMDAYSVGCVFQIWRYLREPRYAKRIISLK